MTRRCSINRLIYFPLYCTRIHITAHNPNPTIIDSPPPKNPSLQMPTPRTLRQSHKNSQHLLIVRRSQPRHRIPSRYGRKPRSPTSLIAARRDIVQHAWIRIECRIEEADSALSAVNALLVDERDDTAQGRRGCRSAVDKTDGAVNSDNVVGAVGRDIRVPAYRLRVVVLGRGVSGFVVCKVGLDGRRLV